MIDQRDLLNIQLSIEKIMKSTQKEFRYKSGLTNQEHKRLKQQLLRGLGFVRRLSTQIQADERLFIKLTEDQFNTFHQALDNKRVIVNGSAGSGKTVLAKELAKELLDKEQEVLLLCFNRTLSSSLREEFRSEYPAERRITVSTFHHFARLQINDQDWFDENKRKDLFWELLIPERLESAPDDKLSRYDAVIVDEGC